MTNWTDAYLDVWRGARDFAILHSEANSVEAYRKFLPISKAKLECILAIYKVKARKGAKR